MLPQAKANHYLTGLRHMQVTIDYLRRQERLVMSHVTEAEAKQVVILRQKVDEGILPTANRLAELLT